MLRFDAGVRVHYWHPRLAVVLEYASAWAALAFQSVDVTSIDDKVHGADSLHHWSLAIDLDTDGDHPADRKRLHAWLARYLPLEYDVVLERDHVHVELDIRGAEKPAALPPVPPAAVSS